MKGNPQNIEVGDVVSFTSIGEPITSVVLSICDQGYISPEAEHSIDGYLVRATVMNKGTICNYPVKELTIVRKWNNTSVVPREPQYKDQSFTVVIKESCIHDTIAIVSDCIEVIKKRQQESAKSIQDINGVTPYIRIDVSGEVTFTEFWIEQVIKFTEKYTGARYTFNTEDKTITAFRLMDIHGVEMSIRDFILDCVNLATMDYIRKERKRALLKEDAWSWYCTDNINNSNI